MSSTRRGHYFVDLGFGVLSVGPIAGICCVLAFFFFAPYPLSQPPDS